MYSYTIMGRIKVAQRKMAQVEMAQMKMGLVHPEEFQQLPLKQVGFVDYAHLFYGFSN